MMRPRLATFNAVAGSPDANTRHNCTVRTVKLRRGAGESASPRCWLVVVVVVVLLADGREPVDRARPVGLARPDGRRREVGVIRRVGVVLGLEREPVALAILAAARPVQRAVEEVARVELDPGLGGGDRQQASARRVEQAGG